MTAAVDTWTRHWLSVVVGERPPRKQPPAHTVAAWWAQHPGVFHVDPDRPECFRCRTPGRWWSRSGPIRLERAHLVDRIRGGLDHEGNLAVLCCYCHVRMPSFGNGEWSHAVTWIRTGLTRRELQCRRATFVDHRERREKLRVELAAKGFPHAVQPTDWYDKAIAATDSAIALVRTGGGAG